MTTERQSDSRRFAIAVSFPGEDRTFVSEVAEWLAEVLGRDRVLYDEWYEHELIGVDGDLKLRRYYREQSDVVVPFFSEHYEKDWCQIEWSAIRAMLKERRKDDAVIPVQLDDTKIDGWEEIDFAIRRKDRSSRDIADLVIAAYRHRFPAPSVSAYSSAAPRVAPSKLPHAAQRLIGRDDALARLDAAWDDPQRHVQIIRAWGGVGKTALFAAWIDRMAADNYRGATYVFDWSFYSQGTRSDADADKAVSADTFIAAALEFFGDPDPQAGSPADRGARLARLVGQSRSLLVLDGVEPLQYPPGPLAGQLTDPALSALLKGLAGQNGGLCIVTTREDVADLAGRTTVDEWPLEQLTAEAGAALLHSLGVVRAGQAEIAADDRELFAAAAEVDGHALTLSLMGRYLALVFDGDVRQRDVFGFAEADAEWQTNPADAGKPYGHAFKVIRAYEHWLPQSGAEGERELAILRMLGLFNRPADAACLAALRSGPAIEGLTDELVGLDDRQWKKAVVRLEQLGLVKRDPPTGTTFSLDAHPLVREYFASRLRSATEQLRAPTGHDPKAQGNVLGTETSRDSESPEGATRTGDVVAPFQGLSVSDEPVPGALPQAIESRPVGAEDGLQIHPTKDDAFAAGHRRLYEHLCSTTEHRPETLAGLQPLYQAVAHGCLAGMQQQALEDVYRDRILRGTGDDGFYSWRKLGAIGADLGAVACFFDRPWTRLSPNLSAAAQAWLLNAAAFFLCALGRLTEAVEPMRTVLDRDIEQEEWKFAARIAGNLSELELTLGEVSAAVADAEQSVTFTDRSGDAFMRMVNRMTLADALHQAGKMKDESPEMEQAHDSSFILPPSSLFREAEKMQAELQPEYPRLYSLPGFRYCDLLLSGAERAAWRVTMASGGRQPTDAATEVAIDVGATESADLRPPLAEICDNVTERATQTLVWVTGNLCLLDEALDHLTLGRAELMRALLSQSEMSNPKSKRTSSPPSTASASRAI